ncbi:MAG TPA: hypothetical protein PLQ81_03985 [bacterium]|nr:hypothetical protein [bacterium]
MPVIFIFVFFYPELIFENELFFSSRQNRISYKILEKSSLEKFFSNPYFNDSSKSSFAVLSVPNGLITILFNSIFKRLGMSFKYAYLFSAVVINFLILLSGYYFLLKKIGKLNFYSILILIFFASISVFQLMKININYISVFIFSGWIIYYLVKFLLFSPNIFNFIMTSFFLSLNFYWNFSLHFSRSLGLIYFFISVSFILFSLLSLKLISPEKYKIFSNKSPNKILLPFCYAAVYSIINSPVLFALRGHDISGGNILLNENIISVELLVISILGCVIYAVSGAFYIKKIYIVNVSGFYSALFLCAGTVLISSVFFHSFLPEIFSLQKEVLKIFVLIFFPSLSVYMFFGIRKYIENKRAKKNPILIIPVILVLILAIFLYSYFPEFSFFKYVESVYFVLYFLFFYLLSKKSNSVKSKNIWLFFLFLILISFISSFRTPENFIDVKAITENFAETP